jgi:hypothetical protein
MAGLSEPTQEFHAIHVRQFDLKHCEVWRVCPEFTKRGLPVGIGCNRIPLLFESERQ